MPIRLPLLRPLRTATGEVDVREGTIVRIETDDAIAGCGEASPYPGFGEETVQESRAALKAMAPQLAGQPIDRLASAIDALGARGSVRAAFETARWVLEARRRGLPLCEALVAGASERAPRVPCNALLGEASIDELVGAAKRHRDAGFGTLKLKVGALELDRDRERVAAVREAIGTGSKLRLDANQAWDLERARAAVAAFEPFDIEYIEQPLPADDYAGMARLRRGGGIPIAIDEGALDLEGLERAIEGEAADVVVIKPSAAGGPGAALAMARRAREADLDVVVTTLLDSAVGVAAAIHSATAIAAEGSVRACGLATQGQFEFDVAKLDPPKDGAIEVARAAGLGIDEDPEMLSRCLGDAIVEIRA